VWTDPRWRAVDAVSRKQVFLSPHLPFGWFDFPRVEEIVDEGYRAYRARFPRA
jgi:ABC-type Fe3+-hydroxamate transport system substrate-binding protein